MQASVARKIALEVLLRVSAEGAYASELLNRRLGPRVGRADAALATELTLGVIRQQRLLDFLLQRHLERPSHRLDAEILIALRMGLYQLRYLDRVPAHAAVGESVELAKQARKHSAAPLVNAVLRRAAVEAKITGAALDAIVPESASNAERLAIVHSHPTWLVERWLARLGSERTHALLEVNNRPASLSCAVIDDGRVAAAAASLAPSGLHVSPSRWLRSALTLSGADVSATEAFRDGQINLQDEASQMVAHLLDAQPGDRVLDLCAAPGGKAMLLAHAVMPDGAVVAADIHEHRLRAMQSQLTRTHTSNVELVRLDAMQPLPFPQTFDRILLDAPCSGTGTLARNPEIRWRLQPDDIAEARRRQVAMLTNALALLRPGGRLVYSTCSLEPEENDDVVREALAGRNGFRVVSGEAALSSHLREGVSSSPLFDAHDFFRTFPPDSKTDGFIAAVIERVK